jgi:hypothetical protein
MSRQNRYIAVLEKLLTHLKNSKLEYFKASDHAIRPEKKRFYNQQGLLRNRFFQDVLRELQQLGMSTDDLVVNRFNFDQLLISTIDTLKASAIEKCVHADETLLSIYAELDGFNEDKSNNFNNHTTHLEDAISQNKEWVSSFGLKRSNSY